MIAIISFTKGHYENETDHYENETDHYENETDHYGSVRRSLSVLICSPDRSLRLGG